MNESLLLIALHILKRECDMHENCEGCPFCVDYSNCGIKSDIPSQWDLLDYEPCEKQLIF